MSGRFYVMYESDESDMGFLACPMGFRKKKAGPNIHEHTLYITNRVAVVTMDKYLIMKKTGKGSDRVVILNLELVQFWLFLAVFGIPLT
jgi:hypothetical protein